MLIFFLLFLFLFFLTSGLSSRHGTMPFRQTKLIESPNFFDVLQYISNFRFVGMAKKPNLRLAQIPAPTSLSDHQPSDFQQLTPISSSRKVRHRVINFLAPSPNLERNEAGQNGSHLSVDIRSCLFLLYCSGLLVVQNLKFLCLFFRPLHGEPCILSCLCCLCLCLKFTYFILGSGGGRWKKRQQTQIFVPTPKSTTVKWHFTAAAVRPSRWSSDFYVEQQKQPQ